MPADLEVCWMYSLQEIELFIHEELGCRRAKITADVDIEQDLGCTGDDMDDLVRAFATRFSVDCDGYRPGFHRGDEVWLALFDWVNPSDGAAFPRIPLTPALLLDCANAGQWVVSYPDVSMFQRRLTRLGYLILGAFGLIVIVILIVGIATQGARP